MLGRSSRKSMYFLLGVVVISVIILCVYFLKQDLTGMVSGMFDWNNVFSNVVYGTKEL